MEEGERMKTAVTFYIDSKTWKGFKKFCHEAMLTPSQLVEAFMESMLAGKGRSYGERVVIAPIVNINKNIVKAEARNYSSFYLQINVEKAREYLEEYEKLRSGFEKNISRLDPLRSEVYYWMSRAKEVLEGIERLLCRRLPGDMAEELMAARSFLKSCIEELRERQRREMKK